MIDKKVNIKQAYNKMPRYR